MKIGIYNLFLNTLGGAEKRSLVTATHLSDFHNVYLLVPYSINKEYLEKYFNVDLSRIQIIVLKQGRFSWLKQKYAYEKDYFCQIKALELDIFINNSFMSGLSCPSKRGIYFCMFPHKIPRSPLEGISLKEKIDTSLIWIKNRIMNRSIATLDSYDFIAANSQFTQEWIMKWWNRPSELIYSSCDPMMEILNFSDKRSIILNVGRFTSDKKFIHHKRQDILVQAFKKLSRAIKDGWELHLAGGITKDKNDDKFISQLIDSAKGYPIFFHFGINFEELHKLYKKASIYWHATGYGVASEQYPNLQEHFGITTVEAMSAGAVPVVINSGGQKNTVHQKKNGFLWDSLEEMLNYTNILINDKQLLQKLSYQAFLDSKNFSRKAFNQRMDNLIGRLAN
ncbi:MAG: glycosyltransferase family 4 protein [Acidobacteria bacterium]|nr:glycosyltransferase family 4 protein [Acidobacteriota bacterium]